MRERPITSACDVGARVLRVRALWPVRLLGAFLATTALATPAIAQDAMSETMPLPRQSLDENGVNPATGTVTDYRTFVSIGPADRGGLTYALATGNAIHASNWTLVLTGDPSTSISLSVGFKSINFTNIGGVLKPDDGSGNTLTSNAGGTQYTLTLEDGTVVLFNSFGIYDSYRARGTSISYPTGEKVTLTYNSIQWCTTTADTCSSYGHAVRLQSVSSSTGYQLHYGYGRDDILVPTNAYGWERLVSVTALNTTTDPCDPAAGNSCTYSQSWPTVTFDSSGGVTDAAGERWVYATSPTGSRCSGRRRPVRISSPASMQTAAFLPSSRMARPGPTGSHPQVAR